MRAIILMRDINLDEKSPVDRFDFRELSAVFWVAFTKKLSDWMKALMERKDGPLPLISVKANNQIKCIWNWQITSN